MARNGQSWWDWNHGGGRWGQRWGGNSSSWTYTACGCSPQGWLWAHQCPGPCPVCGRMLGKKTRIPHAVLAAVSSHDGGSTGGLATTAMEEDGAATPADAAHAALLRTITDTIAKHPEEMELLGAFVKIAKEVKAPVATAEQVKLLDSKAWKESLDKVQKASSACKAAELTHTKQGKKVADCEKALREAQAQLERDQQDVQDKRDHQEKMAAEHRRKFPTGDPGAAAAGADARPQQEPDDLAALQTKDDYHKYKIKLDEQVARLDRLYKQKFPPGWQLQRWLE